MQYAHGVKGLAAPGAVPGPVELVGNGPKWGAGRPEQGRQLRRLAVGHVGLRVGLPGNQALGPRGGRQVSRRPQLVSPCFLGGQDLAGVA